MRWVAWLLVTVGCGVPAGLGGQEGEPIVENEPDLSQGPSFDPSDEFDDGDGASPPPAAEPGGGNACAAAHCDAGTQCEEFPSSDPLVQDGTLDLECRTRGAEYDIGACALAGSGGGCRDPQTCGTLWFYDRTPLEVQDICASLGLEFVSP